MPLLGFEPQVRIKTNGAQLVLMVADQGRAIGLLIDEIADIAEDKLDIKLTDDRPGILGYALINGVITEIIDVGFFLQGSSALGRAA